MMHEASEHGRMNAALFFLERTERFRGVGHANNSSAENVQPVFFQQKGKAVLVLFVVKKMFLCSKVFVLTNQSLKSL